MSIAYRIFLHCRYGMFKILPHKYSYSREFIECADILFLSDEHIPYGARDFSCVT